MTMRRIAFLVALVLAGCVEGRNNVTAPANQPISMEILAGQNDTAFTDSTIALSVHVVNEGGTDDANQLVNWVITKGTGSVFVGATITNASGVTGNRLTLGAGENTVEARAIDSDGNPLTFAVIHAFGKTAPRLVDWIAKWNDSTPWATRTPQAQMTPGVPYDVSKHVTFQLIDPGTGAVIPGATVPIGGLVFAPLNQLGTGACNVSGVFITCNAAALDGSHVYVIPADPGDGYQWIPFRTSAPPKYVNSVVFQTALAAPPATSLTANFTVLCNSKHTCSFDASSSTIPNGIGALGSYNWNFGDGYQGTKVTVIHDYSTTKTVNVTLKIYDSKFNSVSITKSLVTGPLPLVFSSDRGANLDIYTMNSDGTSQTRLTSDPSTDYSPAWSPDRSRIVFVSNRSGSPNIFTMNADGTNQTQLTFGSTNYVPQWSPDGNKIVFISERDGGGASAREVYVMSSTGANQTRLTSNTSLEGFPSWSPDGKQIVFESTRNGPNALYFMGSDGSNQVRLTTTAGNDYQPEWSPNGQSIVFASDRDGDLEIYMMNANGSSQSRLTNSAGDDSKPGWSPDGSRIVFTSVRGGSQDIYLMKADGSGVVQLTNNAAADSYANFPPR
jgi:Tol biopolymer transport system component